MVLVMEPDVIPPTLKLLNLGGGRSGGGVKHSMNLFV